MASTAIQQATQQQAARTGGQPTMQQYIKQMQGEIAKALPSVMTPDRFTRIVLSALSTNKELGEASPQSFLGAMMTAAQLGLEPNTPLGQAYLIPYKNHGKPECQFQIGYKGLIDLAYRSGDVSVIQAHVVYSNDDFSYSFGLEPELKHIPAKDNRGDPVYVYGVFRTKSGGYGFDVMSMEEVKRHAKKFSQAYRNGRSRPWDTNFEEMAKKTVLKRALKYAPLKSEFVRALAQDETIKTGISAEMYEVPDETDYVTVTDDEPEKLPEANPETGEVLEEQQTVFGADAPDLPWNTTTNT